MKREEFEELKRDAAAEIAKRICGKDLSFEETQKIIKAEIALIFSNYLVDAD